MVFATAWVALAVVTMLIAAVTAYRARVDAGDLESFAWRSTREETFDGEARLRVAVSRVRDRTDRTDRTSSGAEQPIMDAWTELFEQRAGGQLFVQGSGRGVHSASDVIVNRANPYAPYLLRYDAWVRKMRALAFPEVPSFADGTEGVFCGSYEVDTTVGKTVALTVCDDVASPAKAPRVRAFWSMLETVVLMHALDDRQKLTGVAHEISSDADEEARAHARRIDAAVDAGARRMRALVESLDERMRRARSAHAARMARLRARAVESERALESSKERVRALEADIARVRDRAERGQRAVSDTGDTIERMRIRLQTERSALARDSAALRHTLRATRESEQAWKAHSERGAVAKRSALVAADAARHREADVARRLAAAREAASEAESRAESEAASEARNRERADALESDAARARRTVSELERERDRLRTRNDALATSIERETIDLGRRAAEGDDAAVKATEASASARALEQKRTFTERQRHRARLEASVREGRVVHEIDRATVDDLTRRVHDKRTTLLARQQALLDAQHAALDAAPSHSDPAAGTADVADVAKPVRPRPRTPRPAAPRWDDHWGHTARGDQIRDIHLDKKITGNALDDRAVSACKAMCDAEEGCGSIRVRNPKRGRTRCVLYRGAVAAYQSSDRDFVANKR